MEQLAQQKSTIGLRWLIGSGILAITCVVGVFAYRSLIQTPSQAITIELLTVELGTVETTISESGQVELGQQQTVKSPQEGAIDRILVVPGEEVQAGQELLILQNPDRQTILNEKQIEIQKQELVIARNRERVREAEESLAAARYDLQAQRYERNLQAETQISQRSIQSEEKQINVERNRQKVKEAQADLQILKTIDLQS